MTATARHARHGAVTVAARQAITMAGPCEPGDALGRDRRRLRRGRLRPRGGRHRRARAAPGRRRRAGHHRLRARRASSSPSGSPPGSRSATPRRRGRPRRRPAALPAAGQRRVSGRSTSMVAITAGQPDRQRSSATTTRSASSPRRGSGSPTVGDLLRHFPRRYVAATELTEVATPVVGEQLTIVGEVRSCESASFFSGNRRQFRTTIRFRTDGPDFSMTLFSPYQGQADRHEAEFRPGSRADVHRQGQAVPRQLAARAAPRLRHGRRRGAPR